MSATTSATAIFIAALTIIAKSQGQPEPRKADAPRQQLIEQAEQRFRAGERDESLRLLSRVMTELDSTPDVAKSPEDRISLVRVLYRRALILADAGDKESASRDVERLLQIAPNTLVDASLVSREFKELFTSVRDRTVTELEVMVEPRDAEVRVDDRLLDSATAIAVIGAGAHVVTAARTGYAAARRTIDLRPGGRVRLEIRLSPDSNAGRANEPVEDLPAPTRWVVQHLHNSQTECAGRLYLEGEKVGFSSLTDEPHSFLVSLAEVREIAGNRFFQGGLKSGVQKDPKFGGTFHISLANGANFNFFSNAFPADQLVSILQTALTRQKKPNRTEKR